MGIFKSIFRSVAYPIIRPAEQAKSSFTHIKGDLEALKELRARRSLQAEQDRQAHLELVQSDGWEGYKPTEQELINPMLIRDPFKRFEVMYALNGWDEPALAVQLSAAKRTKRVSAYTSIFLLIVGLASGYLNYMYSPVWMLVLTSASLMTGGAIGFASSVKYAIYQAQMESRKLMSFKELMSRSDFFSYLFAK